MKKLTIILIAVLGIAINLQAQTKVTEVAPNGYITDPAYVYVFGSTSDTLTNTDADTVVLRIKGNYSQDFNIKAYVDHVSGTAGGTLILNYSINGLNWEVSVGDTITLSSVTSDILDSEVINKQKFLYPYMRLIWTQSGTAVTVPKVFIYTKLN